MAPPAPGEDLAAMEMMARGRNNEVPLDYQGQSPVTGRLDALLGAKPKKEVKLEASVSPMEEAIKPKAKSKAAPMEEAVSEAPKAEPIHTVNVHGVDVSIPLSKITRSTKAWERGVIRDANERHGVTQRIGELLPKALKGKARKLYEEWMAPGVKKDSAYSLLEDLVNNPKVPDDVKGKLLDLWYNSKLDTEEHWK